MIFIKNALANIKAYKLRVFVAMVWIIIGITSVIVVSSIGKGIEKQMDDLAKSKNNRNAIILFEPNDWSVMDVAAELQPFTNKEMELISLISGVESVVPATDESGMGGGLGTEIRNGNRNAHIMIEKYNPKQKDEIIAGRDFSLDDEERNVVIIPEENVIEIYDDLNEILGQAIEIEGSLYEVIGVSIPAVSEGTSMFNYSYASAKVPQKVFDKMMSRFSMPSSGVDKVKIKVAPGYNKDEVVANVLSELQASRAEDNGTYHLPWDEQYEADNMKFMQDSITKFTSIITLVSLMIGGAGIMNIMYMSVIERRREIGIRRAIGAKPRSILFQFVIEATVITVIGGFFGIIVGLFACNYVGGRLPFPIIIDYTACFYATLISIGVGVVFGLIPAYKASKLDPIKAIQGLK